MEVYERDDEETNVSRSSMSHAVDDSDVLPEDCEPIVSRIMLDKACLHMPTMIILRTHHGETQPRTLKVEHDKESVQKESAIYKNGETAKRGDTKEENHYTATSGRGFGLGDEAEIWELMPLSTSSSVVFAGALRYGDTVCLRSRLSNDRLLGVCSVTQHDDYGGNTRTTFQVGCFQTTANEANQWTVLRAVRDGAVRVGQAAINHQRSSGKRRTRSGKTAPVRAGEAVLLRNALTGGLLSITQQGAVQIVTDSYDAERVGHGSFSDSSLISRLYRHGVYTPSEHEIFHMTLSVVPAPPLWISGGNGYQRKFIDMSYLLDDHRHDIDPVVERQLFGQTCRAPLDYSEEMRQNRAAEINTPSGQEVALLDELIGAFIGLEGTFIRIHRLDPQNMGRVSFQLQDGGDFRFDPSLRRLVEELLLLPSAFVRVRHFVATHAHRYEYGRVMQAFCERVDLFLQDYLTFVAGLDEQYRECGESAVTVRNLQVSIRLTMQSMLVLEQAILAVADRVGGSLLNALRKLKDSRLGATHVLVTLLDAASAPYMNMLKQWLQHGIIDDPCGEFMIKRDEKMPWETKFSIRPECLLEGFFATKQTVEKVLQCGRYWNAVQSCRKQDVQRGKKGRADEIDLKELRYSSSMAPVSGIVQSMYHQASSVLLRLLLDDYDIFGSLRLMKRFFLLDQGDFFVHFMDAAEEELVKEVSSVSRGRVQHWLDVSIQLSIETGLASLRTESEQSRGLTPAGIRCRFKSESLLKNLDQIHSASGGIDTQEHPTPQRHAYGGQNLTGPTGLDTFYIEFSSIPFPISLVLSTPVMNSYQLLFRHLFFAKQVERRLVNVWMDHQTIKELQTLRGSLGPAFLLRQRMLHFVQNLIYYMMLEVIEPNWIQMEAAIMSPSAQKAQTVDDILEVHQSFLVKTLEACLLTNRNLIRSLTKLMKTCLLFSDQMKRFMKATSIEDDRHHLANEKQRTVRRNLNDRGAHQSLTLEALQQHLRAERLERQQRVQKQTIRVNRELSNESYQRMITRFDEVFSSNLCDFMLQLKYSDDLNHAHKVNLCIRLDYNGYVTNALGLASKQLKYKRK